MPPKPDYKLTQDAEYQYACPYCDRWYKTTYARNGHKCKCPNKPSDEETLAVIKHDGRKYALQSITVAQLQQYRQLHTHCEMCGKSAAEATISDHKFASQGLVNDHDHATNTFRGVLCKKCNMALGYYERYADICSTYLKKKQNFDITKELSNN